MIENHFSIRQQNVNRSDSATQDMINDHGMTEYDIIAIQEPHLDWRGIPRTSMNWKPVYPSNYLKHEDSRIRSCVWVNKRIDDNNWQQIPVDSLDVTAIRIATEIGYMMVINVYMDGNSSRCLLDIDNALQKCKKENKTWNHAIWLGDFNRHHPSWDNPTNSHLFTASNLNEAEILISYTSKYNLSMCLPKYMPTLQALATGNLTRPDNVFITDDLNDRIVRCKTLPEQRPPCADHFPIETIIDLRIDKISQEPKRNFRTVNWDKFREILEDRLSIIPISEGIDNIETFDRTLHLLEMAIQETVAVTVPELRITQYTKRWWNEELTAMRKDMRRLARKALNPAKLPSPVDILAYKEARNNFSEAIKKAKKKKWDEFLDSVNEKTIWTAKKFATETYTDGGRSRIPTLRVHSDHHQGAKEAESNSDKGHAFYNAFFHPINSPQFNATGHTYPEPKFQFAEITDKQISRAIGKLAPFKAPGINQIPNIVIKECADILIPYLGPLFRATFRLQYVPAAWKDSRTVVLRKPGKASYDNPNSFRPIALLDTVGKVLAACVAEDISTYSEINHIFPDNHFGGRKGRTTTDAIHYLQKFIKDAWRKKQVAVALFLDIKGAFPSIALEVLIHDMRTRGIPEEYTNWIKNRVNGRKTQMCFDNYTSDWMKLLRGIDQGGSESAILFPFYNADILDIPDKKNGEDAVIFMDDTTLIASGSTMNKAVEKIQHMMTQPNGVIDWAKTHGCTFALDKFALIGFTRKREHNPTTGKSELITCPSMTINEHQIIPTNSAKFLGVILDRELRYNEHVNYALAKGSKWVEQFRRLGKTMGGVSAKVMRKYYTTIAIPRMLYAADTFLLPRSHLGKGRPGHINKLARVHRQAALLITGALRTTSTEMLNIQANLPPFEDIVKIKMQASAVRIASLPDYHPLSKPAKSAAKRYVKSHRAPLHEMIHTFRVQPSEYEKIHPVPDEPKEASSHSIQISKSKEEGTELVNNLPHTIQIFSDGSMIDSKVGAAAVLYKDGQETDTIWKNMGETGRHTVFEAEIVGVLLALELLQRQPSNRRQHAALLLDNQAVLQRLGRNTAKSGQGLMKKLEHKKKVLEQQGWTIDLTWSPGHANVKGNERADKLARKAAQDGDCPRREHRKTIREIQSILKKSVSAAKQQYKLDIKADYKVKLEASPRYDGMKKLDPRVPSGTFFNTYSGVSKRVMALLTQLRTDHIPLNKYLFRIGRAESSKCPACNSESESVYHFLVDCDKYEQQRIKIKLTLKRNARQVNYLLSNKKAIPLVIEFIQATNRFNGTFNGIDIDKELTSRRRETKATKGPTKAGRSGKQPRGEPRTQREGRSGDRNPRQTRITEWFRRV